MKVKYETDGFILKTDCPHKLTKPDENAVIKIASYHCLVCKNFNRKYQSKGMILCNKPLENG